jgi:glycosyltransferase involved in cell wall biosynthesis
MIPQLSIVIPTKDRYACLIPVIKELETGFQYHNIEIVIQDNTYDNTEFLGFLNTTKLNFVKYFHVAEQISMSKNCDLSVEHATGEYLILIGDDDYVFPSIFNCIQWMKQNYIEALGNIFSIYQWKGVETKTIIRHIPHETFILQKRLKNDYTIFDTKKILNKVVKSGGGYGPHYLPRLYHGIVKKSVLLNVFETCGTFFPGPSPDMAVAVAVACHLKKHAYFNGSFSVAGASKNSNTGLSTVKENIGKLEDIKFLDRHYIEQWDARIPKVWAVSTIWPQSLVQGLKECNQTANINLAHYYGFLLAFSYYLSPKVVKKIAIEKIKEQHSLFFIIKVAWYYCYVWGTRIHRLLFLKHKVFKDVHNIGDTYKLAKKEYKEYAV